MDWRLDGVGTTGMSFLLLILLLLSHHITSQVRSKLISNNGSLNSRASFFKLIINFHVNLAIFGYTDSTACSYIILILCPGKNIAWIWKRKWQNKSWNLQLNILWISAISDKGICKPCQPQFHVHQLSWLLRSTRSYDWSKRGVNSWGRGIT